MDQSRYILFASRGRYRKSLAWPSLWKPLILSAFGLLIIPSCQSVQNLPAYSAGSVEQPIRLNGFQAQLDYLQSLQTNSRSVDFEFEKTVPGYDNHWLDVYLISPPKPVSDLEEILEDPPDAIRIYLDGYHPERSFLDAPLPPGYNRKKQD